MFCFLTYTGRVALSENDSQSRGMGILSIRQGQFFHLIVVNIKCRETENDRIALPERVSIHLNLSVLWKESQLSASTVDLKLLEH